MPNPLRSIRLNGGSSSSSLNPLDVLRDNLPAPNITEAAAAEGGGKSDGSMKDESNGSGAERG